MILLSVILSLAQIAEQDGANRVWGYLEYFEGTAPGTPATNYLRVYARDKAGMTELFYKNDQGTERDLSASGGAPASTSAELRAQLSDETGTGFAMFGLSTDMTDGLICSGDQVVKRNAGDTAFECGTVSGGSGLTHPQVMSRASLSF